MTVEIHSLPNGVRIVSEAMPSLHSASIGIWVKAGGRHERPEQNGIAHFLEHMAFKGTKTRNALQIAEAIEDVGGYINAYTSREMTAFYARVLENDVSLALDVLADIVLNPVFDPKEIEVERHVILQEIGQAHDTPDDIIFDWLQEAAYPNQALGRTILGEIDRVESFHRDDLSGFVREHYLPENIIIAAAGAIDHDTLVAQAAALFGDLSGGEEPHWEAARFHGSEIREIKPLEQAHFTLGFEGPAYRDEAIYTAQIFSTAFGGGMSSRLFQEARERRGLCYTIFAQAGAYADSGMTTIYAGTSAEEIDLLAGLTIDELKRASEDFSEAEIARARQQMKAGLLMGLESASSRAERLARMLAIWGRVPPIEETIDLIDAVTRDRVRDFAGAMTEGGLAMALYGPVTSAPTLEGLSKRLVA